MPFCCFSIFFRKRSDKNTSGSEKAITKLRESEAVLASKQHDLEIKIETEAAYARENIKTNRRSAMSALRRSKRYGKQLQRIDGTLSTMEMKREGLEDEFANSMTRKEAKVFSNSDDQEHAVLNIIASAATSDNL